MTIAEETRQAIIDWFARKGITAETLNDFGVYQDDGAVCFPYGSMAKKRYGIPNGERSFRWESGTDPILFNRRDLGKPRLFLCEGETDTMRLRQEIAGYDDVGVVGLPGIETWNDSMADDLRSAEYIYVILDNDLDYRVAGRVDEAWRSIRRSLGRKAQRIKLPGGVNDLCEFFEDYSLDSLMLLVQRQPRAGESRFGTVNFNVPAPAPRYVVEDMFVQGDIHLIAGEQNIGKSWITMAAAVSIAEGKHDYLGHKVLQPGRVLYFDEENPEDLVIDRFQRLGLTAKGMENLRVISQAGIRLNTDPEAVLDEANEFEPMLIVLDSLTRIHTEDENSAGAMARLFNDGIGPLAREADAAVVLIHHVNKTEGASWRTVRGSSDITAFPDAAWLVTESDDGTIKFTNFKARRQKQAGTRYLSLVDKADGSIELLGMRGFGEIF